MVATESMPAGSVDTAATKLRPDVLEKIQQHLRLLLANDISFHGHWTSALNRIARGVKVGRPVQELAIILML